MWRNRKIHSSKVAISITYSTTVARKAQPRRQPVLSWIPLGDAMLAVTQLELEVSKSHGAVFIHKKKRRATGNNLAVSIKPDNGMKRTGKRVDALDGVNKHNDNDQAVK